MAQFYRDFAGEPTGAAPSGWTQRWNAPATWEVRDDAGERYLYLERGATNGEEYAVSWNEPGTPTDVEVFGLVETSEGQFSFVRQTLLYVRGSGAVGSEETYAAHLFVDSGGTAEVRVGEWNGGALTAPSGADATFNWPTDTPIAIRYRVNGSTHSVKAWTPASPFTDPTGDEPGTWTFTFTDATISGAGWVAFGTHTGSEANRLYAIGVGTGGDTAPSAATGANAPGNLAGVQSPAVDLTWDDDGGPYTIRRDTVSLATGVVAASYTDTMVTVGNSYDYTVEGSSGVESDPVTVSVQSVGGGVFFLRPDGLDGWRT